MEQRLLREPGRVEAARAEEGDAQGRDVTPSPQGGQAAAVSHPLVPPREGMDAG